MVSKSVLRACGKRHYLCFMLPTYTLLYISLLELSGSKIGRQLPDRIIHLAFSIDLSQGWACVVWTDAVGELLETQIFEIATSVGNFSRFSVSISDYCSLSVCVRVCMCVCTHTHRERAYACVRACVRCVFYKVNTSGSIISFFLLLLCSV